MSRSAGHTPFIPWSPSTLITYQSRCDWPSCLNRPTDIRWQYFSTLERLRLAQGLDPTATTGPLRCDRCRAKVVKGNGRPDRDPRQSPLRRFSARRGRKPPVPTLNRFSHADARWFMSLPEKVQKTQFSWEERLLLAGRLESVLPDAVDEVFYKLGHESNQSLPTLKASSLSSRSSAGSGDDDFLIDSDSDMEASMMDGFRWMEDDEELDLTLDDYHTHIVSDQQSFQSPRSRSSSFPRSRSVTSLPFGTTTFSSFLESSKPSKPALSPPFFFKATHSYPAPRLPDSDLQSRYPTSQAWSSCQSSTKHYQDPEARLKLRVYLASPQKFDEALEFGFPSLDEEADRSSRDPFGARHHIDPVVQTFLDDDHPSVFDALNEDAVDDKTSRSESNDSDFLLAGRFRPAGHHPTSSKPSSTGSSLSSSGSSKCPRNPELYPHFLAGTREMTLRMTLTRPDLRAHENRLHARETDPLALEHLPPVTEGVGDVWDSHPRDGVVKRIWQKLSRKPSAS